MNKKEILSHIASVAKEIETLKESIEKAESKISDDKAKVAALAESIALVTAYADAVEAETRENRDLLEEEVNTLAVKAKSGGGVSYEDIKSLAEAASVSIAPEIEEDGEAAEIEAA